MSRNIELKARDRQPLRTLAACEALGARARAVLFQRDTYFHAQRGRLKLREEATKAQLIAYERADRAEQRESRYRIVEIEEADALKAALESALGIMAIVTKERRLLIWNGVRIHLDRVDGLGAFIEFEAVMSAQTDVTEAEELLARLRDAVEIEDADLISGSYCDLLTISRDPL
jgi:adenylate cyclase class 2